MAQCVSREEEPLEYFARQSFHSSPYQAAYYNDQTVRRLLSCL